MQFSITNDAVDGLEVVKGAELSSLHKWLDDIMFTIYTPELLEWGTVPYACSAPNAYLPPNGYNRLDIDINAVMNLSDRSFQLEFFKHAVHLISNNLEVDRIGPVVVELLRNEHNLSLLRNLRDLKLPIIDTFIQNLRQTALKKANIPLLQLLIESGYAISEMVPCIRGDRLSLLQFAIERSQGQLTSFLLDQGENGNERPVRNSRVTSRSDNSLLDLAARISNFQVVKELLNPRPQFNHGCPEISFSTLKHSIQRRDLVIFHFLLAENPRLREEMGARPWELLGAIRFISSEIWSAIQRYSPDVTNMDDIKNGNALAAAAKSNNIHLVRHLLSLGAQVNGFLADTLNRSLKSGSITALQWAIRNEKEEMAELLIKNGANVNESRGGSTSLHFAILVGNENLVNILLAAGADVNDGHNESVRLALQYGYSVIFDRLLQHGASMPASSVIWDPMESACRGGNLDLTLRVFQEFATPETDIKDCLVACIYTYGCEVVQHLLVRGIIALEDTYYSEVVWAAILCGEVDFARNLFENTRTRTIPGCGEVGLLLAAGNNHFDLAEMFCKAGFKPYKKVSQYEHQVDWPDLDDLVGSCALECFILHMRHDLGTPSQLVMLEKLEMLLDYCERPELSTQEEFYWKEGIYRACRVAIEHLDEKFVLTILLRGIDVNWAPAQGTDLMHT